MINVLHGLACKQADWLAGLIHGDDKSHSFHLTICLLGNIVCFFFFFLVPNELQHSISNGDEVADIVMMVL